MVALAKLISKYGVCVDEVVILLSVVPPCVIPLQKQHHLLQSFFALQKTKKLVSEILSVSPTTSWITRGKASNDSATTPMPVPLLGIVWRPAGQLIG
jgi:hypothetical protein